MSVRDAWPCLTLEALAESMLELRSSRPLCCYDCGRRYERGPDLIVPDDVWAQIAPRPDGGGVLCPNCMHDRCEALGLKNVPAVFKSGPFALTAKKA